MRLSLWISCLTIATTNVAMGHPVPSQAHLRTVDVRVRPHEICVHYRLDVDQLTALRDLVEAGRDKGLKKPAEFYEAYLHWQAPLLQACCGFLSGESTR